MIKVKDVAYPRYIAPDLDVMEAYLHDFGMVTSERTKDALYMRGTDPEHHLYIVEKGDVGFKGAAFFAESEDDLKTLSKADGASDVEEIDEPGGGKRVRLTDPHGFEIEVIHGMEMLDPIPVKQVEEWNFGSQHPRKNTTVRHPKEPAQVKRLGHILLLVPDHKVASDFYYQHLGLKASDALFMEEKSNVVGSFNRCDLGDQPADHHTLALVQAPPESGAPRIQHSSFEVENVDAVMIGHEYLKGKGHKHMWGIGRHFLGSQIFDYWLDPYGQIVEHFTDGDLFDASVPSGDMSLPDALGIQWGPPCPDEFLQDNTKAA